eukprot:COSAG04_NODE_757_length_10542_cov_7.203773_5_plen_123_part_00
MAGALFSLAGKRAVVTGASKGIGAAIAQLFAAAGADVAVLGRDHEGLAATKALVEAEGRRCWVVAADFSTAEGVATAADELLGHAEAWDCLERPARRRWRHGPPKPDRVRVGSRSMARPSLR